MYSLIATCQLCFSWCFWPVTYHDKLMSKASSLMTGVKQVGSSHMHGWGNTKECESVYFIYLSRREWGSVSEGGSFLPNFQLKVLAFPRLDQNLIQLCWTFWSIPLEKKKKKLCEHCKFRSITISPMYKTNSLIWINGNQFPPGIFSLHLSSLLWIASVPLLTRRIRSGSKIYCTSTQFSWYPLLPL